MRLNVLHGAYLEVIVTDGASTLVVLRLVVLDVFTHLNVLVDRLKTQC